MKRILKIVVPVVLILIAIPVALIVSAFMGNRPLSDGVDLAGMGRVVKDGYTSLDVIDVGGGKVAFVDGGGDTAGKAVLAELVRRKMGPEAVSAIFLTHGHPDHTAAVHLFPSAQVYAMAEEIPLLEGKVAAKGPLTRLFGAHASGVTVGHPLHDGEVVEVGDKRVEVVACPGHTAGSAVYLVSGVLFLGDSAGAASDGKLKGAPWVFSDDAAQNTACLRTLADKLKPRAAEIKLMVFAHTGTLSGLDPLLQFAAAHPAG